METYLDIMGEDFIARIEYEITHRATRGRFSGPPELCYPDEPAEFIITDIELWLDRGRSPIGPGFLATGAFFYVLAEFLYDRVEEYIWECQYLGDHA